MKLSYLFTIIHTHSYHNFFNAHIIIIIIIQGKLLNVREASHQQIMKNEEIQNIAKILGIYLLIYNLIKTYRIYIYVYIYIYFKYIIYAYMYMYN